MYFSTKTDNITFTKKTPETFILVERVKISKQNNVVLSIIEISFYDTISVNTNFNGT